MNKEKSLYDEIFMTNEAPDIKDTNSSKDIKDAIDDANLNDTVGMEDIFVFDDKNTEEQEKKDIKIEKEETSSAIKLEDAKFFDLVNNTLVDLRLDLDKVNLDNELAEMKNDSKDNVSPLVNDYNKKDTKELDKTMVNSITLDDFKESKDNNISQVVETPKEVKSKGNLFPWLSYVFVVLLILVAIGGSLTFLVRQFK